MRARESASSCRASALASASADELGEVGDPLLALGRTASRRPSRPAPHPTAGRRAGSACRRSTGTPARAAASASRAGRLGVVVHALRAAGVADHRAAVGPSSADAACRPGRCARRRCSIRRPRRPSAVGLEADHVRGLGAEQAADLLGHDREHARWARPRSPPPSPRAAARPARRRACAARCSLRWRSVTSRRKPVKIGGPGSCGRLTAISTGNSRAVLAHGRQLDRMPDHVPLAGADVPLDALAVRLAQVRRDDQLGQLAADHLLRRVAERLLGGCG